VAIVGEATARRFWPGRQAVGQYVLVTPDRRNPSNPSLQVGRRLLVIGVARDVKYMNLREETPLFVYIPLAQQYSAALTIVTRTRSGQRVGNELRALVTAMEPRLPIVGARTLEEGMSISLVPQRVAALVSGVLGIVGMLLAAMGIYGVTAYMVGRRTREIGVRVALGANSRDVVLMVLWQGMTLVGAGTAIGMILAAGASRLLRTLLFGVDALDPVAFGGTAVLFAAVGLAACYVPVRRAVKPIEALRYE
jgi:hypothetical protein